jgi:hypothetical protein
MFDRVTTLPEHLMLPSRWARAKHWIGNSLNFYRLHMLVFVFVSAQCTRRIGGHMVKSSRWKNASSARS